MKTKARKRIMRHFTIAEISGVDIPAQEGATATIAKRGADDRSFTKQGTPLVIAKFDDDCISYTRLKRKDSTMSTIERDLAALEAVRSKIDILLAELGGKRKQTKEDHRDRQIAVLEEDDDEEDVSEDAKAAMHKFMRGRSPQLAAKMVMRRIATNTLAKSSGSDFLKRVADIREANPKLSRMDAMRKARREHPEAFKRYQAA